MRRFTPCILALAALGSPSLALAEEGEGEDDESGDVVEETGYRDVDLVDGGRTRMEDKRDYTMALIPGVSFVPPGFKLRFQRSLSDELTLIVGAGYAGFGYQRDQDVDADGDGTSEESGTTTADWTRYHGILGLDFQPIGNGMHGFYVGPRVLYRKGQTNFGIFGGDVDHVRTVIVARGLIGYSMVFDPGILMKFGAGFGYRTVAGNASTTGEEGAGTSSETTISGLAPTLEWNMGWAF